MRRPCVFATCLSLMADARAIPLALTPIPQKGKLFPRNRELCEAAPQADKELREYPNQRFLESFDPWKMQNRFCAECLLSFCLTGLAARAVRNTHLRVPFRQLEGELYQDATHSLNNVFRLSIIHAANRRAAYFGVFARPQPPARINQL